MKKTESKNSKNKKQKKELLYTLVTPEDFPKELKPLINKVAFEIVGTADERSKILQHMADILYATSKKGPLDDMRTFFPHLVPVDDYKLTAKDYSAWLEAIRLIMDTVLCEVPTSFLIAFIRKMLSQSITTENKDLWAEVKSHGKKKIYSTGSVSDMRDLVILIQECTGKTLANEDGGVITSKIERSERISSLTRLHALSFALYTMAQINDSISKGDISKDQAIYAKYLMLGVFIGEATNPLHLFHRQLQDKFFKMGASDGVNKRWAPLDKLKEDAKEIADNLWSDEEENIMHHEMAAEIYESLRQSHAELRSKYIEQKVSSKKCKGKNAEERRAAAEQLTDKFLIKTIRDAIVPVAEKWESKKGCILVWGKKGATTGK